MALLKRVLGDRDDRDREFLEFAENIEDQLYRLAYGFCRNRGEAEQYVQDTFVKLLEHWHRLDA